MSSSSIDRDSHNIKTEQEPNVEAVHEDVITSYKVIRSRDADVMLRFLDEHGDEVPEITPEEDRKLGRKLMWIIVGLTSLVDLLLYSDKAVASYASLFEFWDDTGLTQNKYNNSNTLFYVGYIIGQSNMYFVQKLPIGRLLTFVTFAWSAIILLHCTLYNYQGVYAIRFFLGYAESIALPILNTTMAQFLTKEEKAATAPIFYSTCVGVTIPVGFIAYGILNAKNPPIHLWKLFIIIIGGLSFLLAVLVFFIYPNNPSDAKFLSTKEKVWTIRRVQKTTGSAIETKIFKKHQMVEALKDPISWLFALFFLLQQLANNLPYQQTLLFESIGRITNLDSTLVSVASGGFAVCCCIAATTIMLYFENLTAFSVVFWTIPSFVGSIALATIPWGKNIALLAMLCLASPAFGVPWILMFSWSSASASGHTKKITRNAMVMVAYAVSNIISPQLWQEKDGPRYIPAWIVQIVLSFFVAPLIAIVIWVILKRRNTQRLEKLAQDQDSVAGYVEKDGEKVKVNIASLDLTDLENERFIYPL
ncbi:Yct1 protein [Saccharomycopsis crataegensis]|uniref:Yct1 protein n=1 Tax=Saccharomycopsis crataegensis TaxID=43959 RepID=A0AAV5QPV4_9ASCO|nr:Yct1 protein [Saccharomycopsis crataegensis]